MLKLNASGPYGEKDQRKADSANKFVGIGCYGSSTWKYGRALEHLPLVANSGVYSSDDRVFVSVNGMRHGRVGLKAILCELWLVTTAGATIIADGPANRARPYNVGERELADFLHSRGYEEWQSEEGYSEWHPPLC